MAPADAPGLAEMQPAGGAAKKPALPAWLREEVARRSLAAANARPSERPVLSPHACLAARRMHTHVSTLVQPAWAPAVVQATGLAASQGRAGRPDMLQQAGPQKAGSATVCCCWQLASAATVTTSRLLPLPLPRVRLVLPSWEAPGSSTLSSDFDNIEPAAASRLLSPVPHAQQLLLLCAACIAMGAWPVSTHFTSLGVCPAMAVLQVGRHWGSERSQ